MKQWYVSIGEVSINATSLTFCEVPPTMQTLAIKRLHGLPVLMTRKLYKPLNGSIDLKIADTTLSANIILAKQHNKQPFVVT